ncbi:hypothetical protein SAY87_005749 [Trapa incisa]|uniref:Glycosyltransferase n=1 Tax=Trapa incisa TaxID=236973 RepID=A0AAN7K6E3_9MYRT|nr:hypothetical protein SAY87_005749 [Trapa incisa]
MDTIAKGKLHAVLLSSPGMGHIFPVIELGKRLTAHHGFHVTVVVAGASSDPTDPESKTIEAAASLGLFDIMRLPSVDITGLVDPNATFITRLCVIMREAKPAFKAALSAMEVQPDLLILDLFSTEHLILGEELRIPTYTYVATNAWFLALFLYTPTLDKTVAGEYVDQPEPFDIPGCRPVLPYDVIDPMLDRNDQQYVELLRMAREITMGNGILLNTWEELQSGTLAALRDAGLLGRIARQPMYTIGPLIRPNELVGSDTENALFGWLDRQPAESVIYVSFGSGGTLSADQLTELAAGLELSGQRFIWVLRPPTAKSGCGWFFGSKSGSADMWSFLPDGFLERTQGTGLVVRQWAPQVNVLAHAAVGAFMSHCGWNSILESIVNGVPMIAWPLYAEQRMNAVLLEEDFGVAFRPKVRPSEKTVERQEIAGLVSKILVSDGSSQAMRKKVKELKESAKVALRQGGSSYEWLCKLEDDCRTMGIGSRKAWWNGPQPGSAGRQGSL